MRFSFLTSFKYYLIRIIEKIPLIQILIYNYISYFNFFFPHEKDYYGLKKLINTNNKKDFLDVGGNIGLSAIGFRELGFNNRIVIFEPDKNYCVKKLISLKKKIPNLKIIKFALSDKDENKVFYQAYCFGVKMHFLSSFDKKYLKNIINQVYRFFRFFFSIKKQTLSLKKFDKLNLKVNPIFIKIDVEGYDHKVIKGMIKTIKKYKPILLIELNRENFNEINSILKFAYSPYRYIFKKNKFAKISNKEILNINLNFTRSFSLSLPRNIYFLPKK